MVRIFTATCLNEIKDYIEYLQALEIGKSYTVVPKKEKIGTFDIITDILDESVKDELVITGDNIDFEVSPYSTRVNGDDLGTLIAKHFSEEGEYFTEFKGNISIKIQRYKTAEEVKGQLLVSGVIPAEPKEIDVEEANEKKDNLFPSFSINIVDSHKL